MSAKIRCRKLLPSSKWFRQWFNSKIAAIEWLSQCWTAINATQLISWRVTITIIASLTWPRQPLPLVSTWTVRVIRSSITTLSNLPTWWSAEGTATTHLTMISKNLHSFRSLFPPSIVRSRELQRQGIMKIRQKLISEIFWRPIVQIKHNILGLVILSQSQRLSNSPGITSLGTLAANTSPSNLIRATFWPRFLELRVWTHYPTIK